MHCISASRHHFNHSMVSDCLHYDANGRKKNVSRVSKSGETKQKVCLDSSSPAAELHTFSIRRYNFFSHSAKKANPSNHI